MESKKSEGGWKRVVYWVLKYKYMYMYLYRALAGKSRAAFSKWVILACTRLKARIITEQSTILCEKLLYYVETHYIIQTHNISHRKSLYHLNTLIISFKHTKHNISCINSLYHSDTHYIKQKLTISFRHSLYYAETKSFYLLLEYMSWYILRKLDRSYCMLKHFN